MLMDQNGNLTSAATKFLEADEIDLFNSLERRTETWFLERQALAIQLVTSGIQRKALSDVEERAAKTTQHANLIAGIAATAIFIQLVVDIVRLCIGR